MSDLTVLSSLSPIPVYPSRSRPAFSSYNPSASSSRFSLNSYSSEAGSSRPTLSQLSLARESKTSLPEDPDADSASSSSPSTPTASSPPNGPESPQSMKASASYPIYFPSIASPPPNDDTPPKIFAPIPQVGIRRTTRHQPQRSMSAPPERIHFSPDEPSTPRSMTMNGQVSPDFYPRRQQSHSGYGFSPRGPLTSRSQISPWTYDFPATTRGGELIKPPPPLHRPTTFWRRNPRSGVTSSTYSPSTHLIRRSTFIAAGLRFDNPVYDGSAQEVESRLAIDAATRPTRLSTTSEVFWEVIV